MQVATKSKIPNIPETVPKKYLRPFQAAEFLGMAVGTLYNLKLAGELPSYKPGGKNLLFKIADLEAYVERGRIPSNSEIEAEAAIRSAGRRK